MRRPRRRATRHPDGRRALGALGLALLGLAAVPLAAPGPALVPAAVGEGPAWLLGIYGQGLGVGRDAYYGLLWAAFGGYVAVCLAAPALDRRLLFGASTLLIAAFAIAPPLLSADVFSYIDYGRLGALHGLNPYTHSPASLPTDPAYPHVGWTDSPSAYGPLFTLISYPPALLSLPAALWALKAVAAGSVLALAGLVARLAPARGLDPRRSFALVALNPLVLVHVVGGAHNDALMALLLTAGCASVLALRPGGGGAALLSAAALKISAAFALPFALLGAADRGRHSLERGGGAGRFLAAAALAAAALAGASLLAFGPHALDSLGVAGENQGRVSSFSIPNLLSEASNVEIGVVRAIALGAFAALLTGLATWVWRGADWLRACGWAALGLLLATSWLLPWYVVWALPLAALSRDGRLIAALWALTALQLAARLSL